MHVLIGRSSSYDWVGLDLLGGVFVCYFAVSKKTERVGSYLVMHGTAERLL